MSPPAGGSDEEIGRELQRRTLERVRGLVRRNGLDPARVQVTGLHGHIYQFDAVTGFTVESKFSEKRTTGKAPGQGAPNPGAARQAAQLSASKMQSDPVSARAVFDLLLKRADKGFGIGKTRIPLPALNQIYVVHEACNACSSSGRTACGVCHGRGLIVCKQCRGQRRVYCPVCNGNRETMDSGGARPCIRCNAQGYIGCDRCRRSGEERCRACGGKGAQLCKMCGNTGWQSIVIHMQAEAVTFSDMQFRDMPADLVEEIRKRGGELVAGNHAKIEIGKPGEAPPNAILYHTAIPYGEIGLQLGTREPVPCKVFGLNAQMLNAPPFLDGLIAPGYGELKRAATGKGNVAGHLKKASGFRTVGEAVVLAAKLPPGKAAAMLHKRSAPGLSVRMAKDLIGAADSALRKITLRPRLHGLAAGCALTLALAAGYYFTLPPQLARLNSGLAKIDPAFDIVPALLAGLLVMLTMRLNARRAMTSALRNVIKNPKNIFPKSGKSGWIGFAAGIFAWLLVLEATRHMRGYTPGWYATLFQ